MELPYKIGYVIGQIVIESQWNLNSLQPLGSLPLQSYINRITVEFKCHLSISSVNAKSDINRITVEFK